MVKKTLSRAGSIVLAAVATMLCVPAPAAQYTGAITTIEVWENGNVAFRLAGVSGTCATGDWFVLNKSSPGSKNHYAALLAAKLADKEIRISSPDVCSPAENYNSSPYLQVSYMFLN